MTGERPVGRFVTVSGIAVPPEGAEGLEQAMNNRLGRAELEAGFGGLQLWRPVRRGDPYRMVTWWADEAAFRDYMRSKAHDDSHARTPRGLLGPKPAGLDRYWCVAE